jgi:hypothetical protein
VSGSTQFIFSAGDADNFGYLIHIEDEYFRQGLYIVTNRLQFTLGDVPVVNGSFGLMTDEWHTWTVQTHGKFANTDAMAGPNGFLDAFALDSSRPMGPARGDGSYTHSGPSPFKTAP